MNVEKITKLRHLDLDDLIIGTMLFDGYSRKEIHTFLSLTPAAITSRLNKLEDIFGPVFEGKFKTAEYLNESGIGFFELFKQALLVLEDFN